MKYIHEQTQTLPSDSLANTMNIHNIKSIFMVTVIITSDATAYQGTTIFAISYISYAYHIYYGYTHRIYAQGNQPATRYPLLTLVYNY
jgi:hypothetical protein